MQYSLYLTRVVHSMFSSLDINSSRLIDYADWGVLEVNVLKTADLCSQRRERSDDGLICVSAVYEPARQLEPLFALSIRDR